MMEELINELKNIMIEAAERDGNYKLAEKLKQLKKKEVNQCSESEKLR